MAIPLAPYPPPAIRTSIPPNDWSAITQSWNTALTLLLQTPSAQLTDNLITFLISYLVSAPISPIDALRRPVFLLLHRLLSESPKLFDTPGFLEGFARLYYNVPAAQNLLVSLWKSHEVEVEKAVQALKKKHLPVFSKANLTYDDAASLSRVFQLSPKAAAIFLAGEEFVDVALDGDEVVVKLYARAMTEAARVNWSVVVDALYSLTVPSSGKKEKALAKRLAELGLGPRLRSLANGTESESRVAAVVEKLHELSPPPRKVKSKPAMDKGKGIAAPEPSTEPARTDQEEAETASKVDQIRDMFPHLGAGFIRRCLKEIGSVEEVTMALLEQNLPPQLLEADQSEEFFPPESVQFSRPSFPSPSTVPKPSLPERKNIFDNDAFDTLAPSAFRNLTVGKRHNSATADKLLKSSDVPKSAILSALEAFDSDDDERDDTYDSNDVGGAVDVVDDQADDEHVVYMAYQRSAADFLKDARGGAARKALKEATGWTDEQLEGWGVMLAREPDRQRRLERKFAAKEIQGGKQQQVQLERTSWRTGDAESERGRGRGRGGRGRGGPGRGGHAATQSGPSAPSNGAGGPSASGSGGQGGDQKQGTNPSRGRARKEQNKGRVGNHNRREGHAKKMARGFGGGPTE
ncbi:hypothetical protein BZA77DRAFT_387889 [Pyronema omphalodes]|nr:hypothetical protein BZA77DRAFT_387889 [Pyronema omphalodes]